MGWDRIGVGEEEGSEAETVCGEELCGASGKGRTDSVGGTGSMQGMGSVGNTGAVDNMGSAWSMGSVELGEKLRA